MLAVSGTFALAVPNTAANASIETVEAKTHAATAAEMARADMLSAFGGRALAPGQYLWRNVPGVTGDPRVVVGLGDQRAYLYRGATLVAVSTISSGRPGYDTPTGIFPILQKKPLHHSRKYDNAPMPHMQRLDDYGIALHAGAIPGRPASHGCIRLPAAFAAKLFAVTRVGSTVLIGA
jgi:hypothetical protein